MAYQFLFFDLDHTLLDFDLSEDLALNRFFADYGVDDIEAYKTVYRTINRQLWQDLEQGKLTKQELIKTRFAKTFSTFGQTKDGLDLARHYEICLGQHGETYEGALDLLAALRQRGYRLYAATNGVTSIQEERLRRSGLGAYFEQVFISDTLGFSKPDSHFFSTATSQIEGFSLEKGLMIGDNQLADIKGASDFGLDTVWYNPHHKALNAGITPTHQVSSYHELLRILS